MYKSTNPTLGTEIVKQTMARNFVTKIKQYLHFQDNYNLDRNDKYTKIRTLLDLINFMQFGVFEEHLSIDASILWSSELQNVQKEKTNKIWL